jgi:hypothetical protein
MMKVNDLKKILEQMPDDALVVLAQDAEGNAFSPVASHNTNMKYLPDRQPWRRGRIVEAAQAEFGSEHARAAVVLWPSH